MTICILVTGGAGDGRRALRLVEPLGAEVTYVEIDRSRPRAESFRQIRSLLRERRFDLVYLEGTGIVGGLNCIEAHRRYGQRFIVSSGDPVGGYWHTIKGPAWGALFTLYERMLYRTCSGFVGWTPYLVGMALRMGAPRGVTVEGGADLHLFRPGDAEARRLWRAAHDLPEDHLVLGMVGSLKWVPRQQYCYGLELVETLRHVHRQDVSVLIVGDGDGLGQLKQRVSPELADRIRFTGRLEPADVVRAIDAMDIGFITQQVGRLGSYRLTTKLPEYLAAGTPVAMSPIPGFFDYARRAGWALPEAHPASGEFHRACAGWIDGLSREEVRARAAHARTIAEARLDYDDLAERFASFVRFLLQEYDASGGSPQDVREPALEPVDRLR